MTSVGVVTIGQSPRSGVIAELERIIRDGRTSPRVAFLQRGALDGLTAEEITNLRPQQENYHLITVLHDGTEVAVDKRAIHTRVQQAISDLDSEGADIIALVCSDEFPPFHAAAPLILPARLLSGVLSSISINGKLGVMVPSEKQVEATTSVYQDRGFRPIVVSASPYTGREAILNAANRLKERVALVVMDCFGYSLEMKGRVREITGTPVILARSVLARALSECLD